MAHQNPETSSLLLEVNYFLSRWRMALLFLISGIGTRYALRRRSAGEYAVERWGRWRGWRRGWTRGKFIRIHRSRIVNVDRVREIHPWSHGDQLLVLQDGTELWMSRRYRARWSELAP